MAEVQTLQNTTNDTEANNVGKAVVAAGKTGGNSIEFTDVFPAGQSAQGGRAASGDGLVNQAEGHGVSDGIDNIKNHMEGISMKKFGPKEGEPTPADRKETLARAQKALESNPLFKLMSAGDQKAALKLQEAVLTGDTKALGELVKSLADNPERLAALSGAIQDNLKKIGANTQLDLGPDNSLLMYRDGASHAVQIGKDGNAQVRAIEHHRDGSLDILNDRTVVRPTAGDLARSIGDSAVNHAIFNAYCDRSIQFSSPIQKDTRPSAGGQSGSSIFKPNRGQ